MSEAFSPPTQQKHDEPHLAQDVLLWIVNDYFPTEEDRELAESRKAEILDDIPFDVLYAHLNDEGEVGMDADYIGGLLLLAKERIDATPDATSQLTNLNIIRNMSGHNLSKPTPTGFQSLAPSKILRGELGQETQLDFLRGIFYGVQLAIEATQMEDKVTEA